MKRFNKSLICIIVYSFLIFPVYGKVKEKAISWDNSAGHSHDGATAGKKVDSGDVINTPSGDIVATDTQAAVTELDTEKISTSEKGAANGVASLGAGVKVPVAEIPVEALTDVSVCASQICQLALVAEEGDVCVRSDEGKSYSHNGGTVGDMTDWAELIATGAVVNHADLGSIGVSDHHSSTSSGISIVPDDVSVTTTLSSDNAYTVRVSGDADTRFVVKGDGSLNWGDGTNPTDSSLARISAGGLLTNSLVTTTTSFQATPSATSSFAFRSRIPADTWPRYQFTADGTVSWGPGGASTVDTQISRIAANTLSLASGDTFNIISDASYLTHGTTTKIRTFGAAAFRPLNTTDLPAASFDGNYDDYIVSAPADGTVRVAVSGVNLPIGCVVTRLDSYGFTEATINNQVSLFFFRTAIASNSPSTMANAVFDDAGSTANDTSITDATISSAYTYKLAVRIKAITNSQNARFYNCSISYTTTNMGMTQ